MNRKVSLIDYGFLTLLSALLLFQSLNIYFVSDNIAHIQKAWANLFNFQYYYYRPVSVLTLALDKEIWGAFAPGYHLMNALWHLLNVFLVYTIALEFKAPRETALGAAVIFLVHPIHGLNIFWISGRTDMVCSFFFLLSFLYTLRWLRGRERRNLLLAILCFTLSLLAKEMALGLPFVLLALLWYEKQWNLRRVVTLLSPFLAVIAVVFALRFALGNHELLVNEMHHTLNPLVLMKNMVVYLGLLIVPGGHEIIALFLRAHPAWFGILTVGALSVSVLLFLKFRPSRKVVFWILFILFTLLPVLRLTMRWYLYIPSAGFALGLAFWLYEVSPKKNGTRILPGIIALLFTLFLFQQQNRWLAAGDMAKQISGRFVQRIEKKQASRYTFLTVPAELQDTPVFMFGFQEYLHFRMSGDFSDSDAPEILSLSKISLSNRAEWEKLNIVKIDSLRYDLSVEGTQAEFIFPNQADWVTGKVRAVKGVHFVDENVRTDILETDTHNRVQKIRLTLLNEAPKESVVFGPGIPEESQMAHD